jgi:predicted RNA polymerase sigma factor
MGILNPEKQDLTTGIYTWNNKGDALNRLGLHSEAKECFRKAQELGYAEAGQILERLEQEGH